MLRYNTPHTIYQFIRYCCSGALAFLVDFSLLWLLTDVLHLHYLISTTVGYSIGLVITYILSIIWIFDERRMDSRSAEFFIFVLIGLVGLGLTQLFMWIFSHLVLGEEFYLFSKLLTTVIVSIFTFIAKKVILFTRTNNHTES